MKKRLLAALLAAAMLLEPVAASAVTWKELAAHYAAGNTDPLEGTSLSQSGGVTTVTGGTLDFSVKAGDFLNASGTYVLNGVTVGYLYAHADDPNEHIVVLLGKDTAVGDAQLSADTGSSVHLENDGSVDSLRIYGDHGSQTSVNSAGEIGALTADLYGDTRLTGSAAAEHVVIMIDVPDGFTAEDVKAVIRAAGVSGTQSYRIEAYPPAEGDGEEGAPLQQRTFQIEETADGYTIYELVYEDGSETPTDRVLVGTMPKAEPQPAPQETEHERQQRLDEERRQREGVNGVTTSIFWNKQMYLGHSTYNGRVYVDGERAYTRQRVYAVEGGINYVLRLNLDAPDPSRIELKLAQDILDVCKRAEILYITVVDKNNKPIAQFAVADLLAAREQYGLAADDLLCVSADPSAPVCMETADGTRRYIEDNLPYAQLRAYRESVQQEMQARQAEFDSILRSLFQQGLLTGRLNDFYNDGGGFDLKSFVKHLRTNYDLSMQSDVGGQGGTMLTVGEVIARVTELQETILPNLASDLALLSPEASYPPAVQQVELLRMQRDIEANWDDLAAMLGVDDLSVKSADGLGKILAGRRDLSDETRAAFEAQIARLNALEGLEADLAAAKAAHEQQRTPPAAPAQNDSGEAQGNSDNSGDMDASSGWVWEDDENKDKLVLPDWDDDPMTPGTVVVRPVIGDTPVDDGSVGDDAIVRPISGKPVDGGSVGAKPVDDDTVISIGDLVAQPVDGTPVDGGSVGDDAIVRPIGGSPIKAQPISGSPTIGGQLIAQPIGGSPAEDAESEADDTEWSDGVVHYGYAVSSTAISGSSSSSAERLFRNYIEDTAEKLNLSDEDLTVENLKKMLAGLSVEDENYETLHSLWFMVQYMERIENGEEHP